MALPLSTLTDGEEEEDAIHRYDAAGYAQLPVDHLSDSSSESNYVPADDLIQDTPAFRTVSSSLQENSESDANLNQDGIHECYANGIRNQEVYSTVTFHDDDDLQTSRQTVARDRRLHNENGGNNEHVDYKNESTSYTSHTVQIDGMEVHIYGELVGLQTLDLSKDNRDFDTVDDMEDVDEYERQCEEDAAMLEAKQAEEARRAAPLSPNRCEAIKNAMQRISLGGYRPDWADKVPEKQWLDMLRKK
ncbi:hypothetical protein KP509_37G016600 [Ceratopteris richardii]|uniref:Uncharacterized protein n=1 Tax=Ceratopteris richardii TaxID=49495 RepID=A0A8T2Q6N0_CERRI|nr:hypothetical protein KP509_37G016600 [Ceratopteris richardii]